MVTTVPAASSLKWPTGDDSEDAVFTHAVFFLSFRTSRLDPSSVLPRRYSSERTSSGTAPHLALFRELQE